jgi:hypothetical protein
LLWSKNGRLFIRRTDCVSCAHGEVEVGGGRARKRAEREKENGEKQKPSVPAEGFNSSLSNKFLKRKNHFGNTSGAKFYQTFKLE